MVLSTDHVGLTCLINITYLLTYVFTFLAIRSASRCQYHVTGSLPSAVEPSLLQARRSGTLLPESLRDPALSSSNFRQLLKTNFFNRYLLLSTLSAVEILHDSALYKCTIDIDIDILPM